MICIFENEDLTQRNSFHVRQRATRIIEFDDPQDLVEIFSTIKPESWFAMGGGNNILFTKDVEQTIIVARNQRIDIVTESDSHIEIEAGAGIEWDDLVKWSVERNLWGLENLSLIPGKVGAAPVQNIGAYGVEAKDCIVSVEMFHPETCKFVTLAAEHCGFGYRESVFKHSLRGRVIITSVRLRLSKQPQPKLGYGDVEREVERRGGVSLRNIREAICDIRRSKLPDTAVTGNAGSFFKNPVVEKEVAERLLAEWPDAPHYPTADNAKIKLAAGWLIDKAGMKGVVDGNVGVHPRQALVLINTGGASGNEVLTFARKVQAEVFARFGIAIDTEVNIM